MTTNPVNPSDTSAPDAAKVLYTERQWVPWYWWAAVAGLTLLLAGELALNRNMWWFVGGFVVALHPNR